MKIGWSPYAAPVTPNGLATGGSTTSFSQLLAAGYSADAIRGQRALGFGETGLLGASRKVEKATVPQHSPNKSALKSQKPTNFFQSGQNISAMRPTAVLPAQQLDAASGIAFLPGKFLQATSQRVVPTRASEAMLPSPDRYGTEAANRKSVVAGGMLRTPKKWRVRRKSLLELLGPDDAACLTIRVGAADILLGHDQINRFYVICSQFGVTLDAVRLFEDSKVVIDQHRSVPCK